MSFFGMAKYYHCIKSLCKKLLTRKTKQLEGLELEAYVPQAQAFELSHRALWMCGWIVSEPIQSLCVSFTGNEPATKGFLTNVKEPQLTLLKLSLRGEKVSVIFCVKFNWCRLFHFLCRAIILTSEMNISSNYLRGRVIQQPAKVAWYKTSGSTFIYFFIQRGQKW